MREGKRERETERGREIGKGVEAAMWGVGCGCCLVGFILAHPTVYTGPSTVIWPRIKDS